MPTYRVNVILQRTYGTALVKAESADAAQKIAEDGDNEIGWDSGDDYDLEILDVFEETV